MRWLSESYSRGRPRGRYFCSPIHYWLTRQTDGGDDGKGGWCAFVGSCNWLSSDFTSFETSLRMRDPLVVGQQRVQRSGRPAINPLSRCAKLISARCRGRPWRSMPCVVFYSRGAVLPRLATFCCSSPRPAPAPQGRGRLPNCAVRGFPTACLASKAGSFFA